jgi:hypothetical protein
MPSTVPAWRRYVNRLIAREISLLTRYYDRLIEYERPRHDDGLLFELIECAEKTSLPAGARPICTGERDRRSAVLLNGTLNHCDDIQALFEDLRTGLSRTSRLIAVVFNPYFGWLYRLANRIGLRGGSVPTTFVTFTDLGNLARLSGFRVVRTRSVVYSPWRLAGMGTFLNVLMPIVPLGRHLSLTTIVILAPIFEEPGAPTVTVLIPARNERGNIEPALQRLRDVRAELPGMEVILVEGHSTDGTWEEIQRLAPVYASYFNVRIFKQEGQGKGDAVRLGFHHATGELLTILDADLTVPPVQLLRFYEAYRGGHGEFINGSRLVYAAEHGAMRFLNRLGNVFFAKLLSAVLSVRLGDSLCGTKLFARHDHARFCAWRRDFGDFDPFGDFELLFPAAVLGLTVVDVPIKYGARSYGDTNISRFRHGWMLLKMTLVGFVKVRVGRG